MGSKGSLTCRAYPDTVAIGRPTHGKDMPRIEPGTPDPQSNSLPPRHRGRPVKPRLSQTKSPVYYLLKLTPHCPPLPGQYIQSRKKRLGYRKTSKEYIFIHYVSSHLFHHVRFLREPNCVKDKIKFSRHYEIYVFHNYEIIIPLSQEKISLLRDNFLVKPTWFSLYFDLFFFEITR